MNQLQKRLAAALLFLLPVSAQTLDLRVKSWTTLTSEGGRVSWSDTRNLIAFDRVGGDGFYEVWTMRIDGTNQACLTCSTNAIPNRNRGNPDWHPSGNYIVFMAQKDIPVGPNGDLFARPGVGVNNDLYVMNAAGTSYWRLTDTPAVSGGVLHPHFSHSGTKLLWAERTSVTPLPSGTWVIRVADFSTNGGVPTIANVQTIDPAGGGAFYETHAFSMDDRRILFSANLEPGQSTLGIDQYWLDLSTGMYTNITRTQVDWDEHGNPNPQGNKILFSSNTRTSLLPGDPPFEYWMMNVDGGRRYRVTWLNDPRGPDYQPMGVTPADSAWTADGLRLIMYMVDGGADELGKEGTIALFEFEPAASIVSAASFGRLFLSPDSIASAFGSGLATGTAMAGRFLTTSLAGTIVTIRDAKSVTRQAQLFYASPGQVNFLVPAGTAAGPAVITIRSGNGAEIRSTVTIERIAPGIFSANSQGRGAAAAYVRKFSSSGAIEFDLIYGCPPDGPDCSTEPVDFGEPTDRVFLTLYGTGIRGDGAEPNPVTVQIGGLTLPVLYAGGQSEYPGLDQIDVELPRSLRGTGIQDVFVTVGGVLANVVQVGF